MNEKEQINLQEQIIDYFNKYDDVTFIKIVESFVYSKPNHDIGDIISAFLTDNGVEDAYLNYVLDSKDNANPDELKHRMFNRCTMSQREMIELIKHAMLNAAFNRFRKFTSKFTKLENKHSKLKASHTSIKKSIDKLMDAGSLERYDEGFEELKEFYLDSKK